MKDFYIRTARHWIKVTRNSDKSFNFALGYSGIAGAFRVTRLSKQWMPTIKEAKEHAQYIISNEQP